MPFALEVVISVIVVLAGLFTFAGAIGLLKLPDLMTRLHAPTLSVTLGVGCTIIATILYFSYQEQSLQLEELIVTLLLLFSAPVSAHMIGKAALHQKVELFEGTVNKEVAEDAHHRKGRQA